MSLHVTPGGLSDTASDRPVTIACPETAGPRRAGLVHVRRGGGRPARPAHRRPATWQVFDTAPLPQDIEILGFPILHLRVASDVPQANLAAVLSLVAPDGRATFVSHGVLNLTHRDSHADPVVPADRDGGRRGAAAQRHRPALPAGYRLRLALSQAYWPIIWPSAEKAVLTSGAHGSTCPRARPRHPTRNCPNSARPKVPNR
jgi:predicted acyl esterase